MCDQSCHCEMQFCDFINGCTKGEDNCKEAFFNKYSTCDTCHIPLFLYLIIIWLRFLPVVTLFFFLIKPSVAAIARFFYPYENGVQGIPLFC